MSKVGERNIWREQYLECNRLMEEKFNHILADLYVEHMKGEELKQLVTDSVMGKQK